ncbi:MAG: oligosaccharide flippase family protein [Pseudomonadota bacterium]
MFSKVLLILSGNAGAAFLTLLRNLLVARLISVEDYGIAATFAVVMAMVEVVSTFGLQQQIIQAKQDDPDWQAALQGFQVLRAAVSAGVLFVFAPQIAGFLGVPDIAWAYQILAIAPLMNGIVHLDIYRLNRQMVYLPLVLSQTGPALVSFLMVWPLWLWFGDWRVMLIAVVAQWVLMAGISIAVSERRYRLRLERQTILGAVKFGWPLLVNSMLLFAVMNGEKLIVARELGMATLAIFAMGFTLTLTPTLVMARSIQSFFLPQLSAVQGDDTRFQPLACTTIEANFFNGALLIVGVVFVGAPFVEIVLGEKYAPLIPLLTWLAILQALRVFKAGGAVVGLARAKTENAMVSNLFRVLSLPLSWWAAVSTGDLLLVIWIASMGEALGAVTSLILARYRAGVRLAPLTPFFIAITGLILAAMAQASWPSLAPTLPDWLGLLATGVMFLLCLYTMRATRSFLRTRTLVRHETG